MREIGEMKSTYKGDSSGKKIARARLWMMGASIMELLGVPYRGSLVLTGGGGDIATLKGLGFNPRTITSVDLDPQCTEVCYQEHPDIFAYTGDIREVSEGARYNATHLDYCGGLTIENIDILVKTVLNASSFPCFVGITMLKGREQRKSGSTGSLVPKLPRWFRRELTKSWKRDNGMGTQLLRHGKFNPQLCLKRSKSRLHKIYKGTRDTDKEIYEGLFKKSGELTGLGSALIRIDALRWCANSLLLFKDIELISLGVFGYHSQDETNGGVPFVTSVLLALPIGDRSMVMEYLMSHPQLGEMVQMCNLKAKEGHETLRPFALDMLKGMSSSSVSKVLGIPKGTLIAWKAHESRGSYPERDPIVLFNSTLTKSKLGWGNLGI